MKTVKWAAVFVEVVLASLCGLLSAIAFSNGGWAWYGLGTIGAAATLVLLYFAYDIATDPA